MPTKELRRVVELERERARRSGGWDDLSHARAVTRDLQLQRNAKRIPDDIDVEPVDAGGVGAEWVIPPLDPERRVAVFVHGGGWAFGSAEESRELTARLARAAQARVLALDVRLAPEHRHPAPVEDLLTAFAWLVGDGADPREIALVGESTGASVVLSAALRLRDAGGPAPGTVALLSPVLDLRERHGTDDELGTLDALSHQLESYLGGADPGDPLVSPVLADPSGLPPLLVQVGGADAVAADGRRLAEAARQAGVTVVEQDWEGMPHRWQTYPHVYDATRAIHQAGDFLLRRIGPGSVPVRPAG
jgi:acetyl esterase/lipase